MNYLKYFLIFSLLGFIMESVVYKVSGSNSHSGVLLGPYTLVYGFGGLFIVLINNYFDKIPMNNFLKLVLLFIIFTVVCTLIEYLIGNLIHLIFNIDKWNYTSHKYHFGKYICLDLALTWGFLAVFVIKILKTFLEKLLLIIPNNATIIIFIILIIDLVYTLFTKAYK